MAAVRFAHNRARWRKTWRKSCAGLVTRSPVATERWLAKALSEGSTCEEAAIVALRKDSRVGLNEIKWCAVSAERNPVWGGEAGGRLHDVVGAGGPGEAQDELVARNCGQRERLRGLSQIFQRVGADAPDSGALLGLKSRANRKPLAICSGVIRLAREDLAALASSLP
jgi:hypothetical protein